MISWRLRAKENADRKENWNDRTDDTGRLRACKCSQNVNNQYSCSDLQLKERAQSSANRLFCNFAAVNLKYQITSCSQQFMETMFCNMNP